MITLSYDSIFSTCDTDKEYDDGLSLTQSQVHSVTGTAVHVRARLRPEIIVEPKKKKSHAQL